MEEKEAAAEGSPATLTEEMHSHLQHSLDMRYNAPVLECHGGGTFLPATDLTANYGKNAHPWGWDMDSGRRKRFPHPTLPPSDYCGVREGGVQYLADNPATSLPAYGRVYPGAGFRLDRERSTVF